jgi:hypothetical protein
LNTIHTHTSFLLYIPVSSSIADTGILIFTSICTSIADTGKILVLPVLCTSIVVPVSRPAASYYPINLEGITVSSRIFQYLHCQNMSIVDTGRFWEILVIPVLQTLEDSGKYW